MSLSEIVRDNLKTLVGLGLGYYLAVRWGYVAAPEIEAPTGWGLVVTAAIVVGVGAYYYSDRILDLLPDEEGIYVIAFESGDEAGGEIWELTEDKFADMRVVNGSLFQWPNTGKRAYEARNYDPERNVAVANWRESVAGSELAGNVDVARAFAAIKELREQFEPEAERFRYLQRNLNSVARELDKRRAEDQARILADHTAPGFDGDRATVSEVVRESLPADLLPDPMDGDAAADRAGRDRDPETNGHDDGGEFAGFELLDDADAEPLEPEGEP